MKLIIYLFTYILFNVHFLFFELVNTNSSTYLQLLIQSTIIIIVFLLIHRAYYESNDTIDYTKSSFLLVWEAADWGKNAASQVLDQN